MTEHTYIIVILIDNTSITCILLTDHASVINILSRTRASS